MRHNYKTKTDILLEDIKGCKAEKGLPCVHVQEYLKSGYEIKRLQNLLEVSEKEHYKTLQQLAIATKALEAYERGKRIRRYKMKKDCMFLVKRLNGKVQTVHPLDERGTEVQIHFKSEYLTDKDIRFLYEEYGFGEWGQTYEDYLEDVRQRGYARKEEEAMNLTCELSQYTVRIEHKEIDFE